MSEARIDGEPGVETSHAVPPGAQIRVLRGFFEGLELPIDRSRWVIGRGRGADAVLPDPTISRAHALIGFQPGTGFFVQDLGSTNGTMLNGARTQRAALADGDEIQMGKLQLRIALPGETP